MKTLIIFWYSTPYNTTHSFADAIRAFEKLLETFGSNFNQIEKSDYSKVALYNTDIKNPMSFSKFWDAVMNEYIDNPNNIIPTKFIDWQLKYPIDKEIAWVTTEYDLQYPTNSN